MLSRCWKPAGPGGHGIRGARIGERRGRTGVRRAGWACEEPAPLQCRAHSAAFSSDAGQRAEPQVCSRSPAASGTWPGAFTCCQGLWGLISLAQSAAWGPPAGPASRARQVLASVCWATPPKVSGWFILCKHWASASYFWYF